uniref:acid phosphatase n=1 Tax=Photinus pyralis TaxID=7054 RepID=A0A1Y1NBG3_PHOPY
MPSRSVSVLLCLGMIICCCAPLTICEESDSEIILVHAIFRHGERTPSRSYPTDPYKNETFYPIGLGGLTNNGKLMMFKLGEILRYMYGGLLGDVYNDGIVYVRSRYVPRTQMSALLVLAGMWPPNVDQKWHPSLNWQPIPVQYERAEHEQLLDPVCKNLQGELNAYYEKPEIEEKYIRPYREFFNFIENHTGLKINDFRDISRFYFTLKTEEDNGLILPEWTRSIYPEPLHKFAAFHYAYKNLEKKYRVINSGFLVKQILKDSLAKVDGTLKPANRKIFLYSAHETTLGYLLFNLRVFPMEVPDYGNAILVELHKRHGEYFLKIRYLRTPLAPTVEELTIPDCKTLCPIERFEELQRASDFLPGDTFHEDCY